MISSNTAFPCQHAGDRKDYAALVTRTLNGTTHDRIVVAKLILNAGHSVTDCRALDNCFEMGDGFKVMAALKRAARAKPEANEGLTAWLNSACEPTQPNA